jgi:tRNA pseudouridine55 synthase
MSDQVDPVDHADQVVRTEAFGILLVDKPPGPTSHDVVGWVRWALRQHSVGHCGTLDPPASGLLIVCVGAATKLVDHLTSLDKQYRARFVLGRSTSTADAEGVTIADAPVPPDIEARALDCLRALRGAHELPPPSVSAVRLDGRRAHELARAGEVPELPPRPMTVLDLEIHEHGRTPEGWLWIDATLRVTKGTYIRSLAEELGRRLGLPAHLGALRRLACGTLRLDDPQIVGPLVPVELPPIEGRPPKWRMEPGPDIPGIPGIPGIETTRERTAAWLRTRMSPPWRRLPFETSELSPAGAHGPLLARLLQGQRLRADGETLAALGLNAAEGACAIVDRAGGHVIILAREQGRIAPHRVLRFDPNLWPDH